MRARRITALATITLIAGLLFAAAPASGQSFSCPVDVATGIKVFRATRVTGGGMAGDGWDGPGANAMLLYWHMENISAGISAADQRQAYIAALTTWANVVQVSFEEVPVANQNRAFDLAFATGNHCAFEPAECGDADCPFGPNTLAHAGFPPGVNSQCVNPMPETYAGNVHFNDAFAFSRDANVNGTVSLRAVAEHEMGHALGLTHDTSSVGGPHIMAPNINANTPAYPPSAEDTANLRQGYAAGTGSVVTLETLGVWVQGSFSGTQLGTFFNPFTTVAAGAAGVPPGSTLVTLNVRAGSYPGAVTIAQPMFLKAPTGPATIGGP